MTIVNALSVDVEDWFQVGAFETVIARDDWPSLEARVEANTDRLLALFAEAGVKATFFTLAWVAERHPALIRRIVDQGHEIASHGCDHRRVSTMEPEAFRDDLKRARAVLEHASGKPVTGYRAPSFSIDARTPWAHPILAEEGYAYSSSVAPIRHDHYGWPEAPRHAYRPVAGAALVELPMTFGEFLGRTIPTGGGFFRLFPQRLSDHAVRQINRVAGRPAIFYIHPWDLDPDQPRVARAPIKSRLRHYARLRATRPKLARFVAGHCWGRYDGVAAAEGTRLQ